MTTVGVAIPSIPSRTRLLLRAVQSVAKQTRKVDQISIAYDIEKLGAGPTRNRAKNGLRTEWTCFLDDDDEFLPHHVEALLAHQQETGTDIVFSWFDVIGGRDPFPQFERMPWDDAVPRSHGITVLIRTEVAQAVDFRAPKPGSKVCGNEDWDYFQDVRALGATTSYLQQRTWRYHHDSGNTSGLPSRAATISPY